MQLRVRPGLGRERGQVLQPQGPPAGPGLDCAGRSVAPHHSHGSPIGPARVASSGFGSPPRALWRTDAREFVFARFLLCGRRTLALHVRSAVVHPPFFREWATVVIFDLSVV